jgi:hypothetical protein
MRFTNLDVRSIKRNEILDIFPGPLVKEVTASHNKHGNPRRSSHGSDKRREPAQSPPASRVREFPSVQQRCCTVPYEKQELHPSCLCVKKICRNTMRAAGKKVSGIIYSPLSNEFL